jgi:hypothetical protein
MLNTVRIALAATLLAAAAVSAAGSASADDWCPFPVSGDWWGNEMEGMELP